MLVNEHTFPCIHKEPNCLHCLKHQIKKPQDIFTSRLSKKKLVIFNLHLPKKELNNSKNSICEKYKER